MKKRRKEIACLLFFIMLLNSITGIAYAASGDTIVYRTKSGEKYHTKNCSYLKSSIALSLQEAVNMGLSPCSRCKPPTLDVSPNTSSGNKKTDSSANNTKSNTKGNASTVNSTGTQFEVTIKANCSDYNQVGNEWLTEYSISGNAIKSGSTIVLNEKDKLKIVTTITELDDSSDDVGKAKTTHTVTKKELESGFTVSQTITVTENGGRYKGKSAKWEVEYIFSRKK